MTEGRKKGGTRFHGSMFSRKLCYYTTFINRPLNGSESWWDSNRREMIHKELYYKYHKSCQSFQNPSFQKGRLFLLLQTDGWGGIPRVWAHVCESGVTQVNGRKREEASYSISWKNLLLYFSHQPTTERSLSTMKLKVDNRWSAGRNVAIISAKDHVTKSSGWLAACLPYSWTRLFIRILPLNLQRIVGQAFTCLEPT